MAVDLSTEAATDLVLNQLPRIQEDIAKDSAERSPWLNLFEGGTVDLINEDNSWTTVVQEPASAAGSYVQPAFVDSESAFTVPDADSFGQTKFTTKIQRFEGRGPTVSINQGAHYLKNSLIKAKETLKDLVVLLKNNDIRYQALDLSGVKFVARRDTGLDALTGGRNTVQAAFYTNVPDGTITFPTLTGLASYFHEVIGAEKFGTAAGAHYVFMGGMDIVEKMRTEGEILNITTTLTQGGFTEGETRFKTFMFNDFQNRGIRMAVEQYPLRYTELDDDDQPVLIEPFISANADEGKKRIVNPDWVNAAYEIGFLIGKNGFRYRVPSKYVGEGDWKFAPQMIQGELRFNNHADNGSNMFQDHGYFAYRVKRLFEVVRPHAVMPIAFLRSKSDLGIAGVDSDYIVDPDPGGGGN